LTLLVLRVFDRFAFASAVFARIRRAGVPFGDAFHDSDNLRGPGDEDGARGHGKAVYLMDPNRHLLEIRHYPGE
jgi:hypothetical protein